MNSYYASLVTEKVNSATSTIDGCSTQDMLLMINDQDHQIADAVRETIPSIAKAVDLITACLKRGGKLYYVGAGTSGRLGVLDASECPPTFGTDISLIQAYIAGGDVALRTAVEGCEDDEAGGEFLIKETLDITDKDVVVGITASGTAAFVWGAVKQAKRQGAATICVVNNKNSRLASVCDIEIAPIVGPEVIIGSTRMKSGTSQKLVLNMLSTGTMIKMGKVYGNLMVDLKASNKKLYARAVRIVHMATGVSEEEVSAVLQRADMNAKLAIMMIKTGLEKEVAEKILEQHEGHLKHAIESCNDEKRRSGVQ